MTAFSLLLLLSLSASVLAEWPPQIYVPVGGSFTLHGVEHPNITGYFWSKRRAFSDGMFQLTHNGNCSLVGYLKGRIPSCRANLTVLNATRLDSGEYAQRTRNNTFKQWYAYFNVTVFSMTPALSVVRMIQRKVALRCDDLDHRDSQTDLQVHNLKPELGENYYLSHKPYLKELVLEGWPRQPMLFRARCCVTRHNHTRCDRWVKVNHDYKLCNSRAPNRNWCVERGNSVLRKWFNYADLVDGPPEDGQCWKWQYYLHDSSPLLTCEGRAALFVSPFNGSWIMHRPWGGLHRIQKPSLTWYQPFLTFNYTGSYFVKRDGQRLDFQVETRPTLRAVVGVIRIYDNHMKLRCTHNGSPSATIQWDIIGFFEDFIKHGDTVTVKPDCWHSYEYWRYHFALRCEVHDGPWSTTSPWFRASAYRLGGNCDRLIDDHSQD